VANQDVTTASAIRNPTSGALIAQFFREPRGRQRRASRRAALPRRAFRDASGSCRLHSALISGSSPRPNWRGSGHFEKSARRSVAPSGGIRSLRASSEPAPTPIPQTRTTRFRDGGCRSEAVQVAAGRDENGNPSPFEAGSRSVVVVVVKPSALNQTKNAQFGWRGFVRGARRGEGPSSRSRVSEPAVLWSMRQLDLHVDPAVLLSVRPTTFGTSRRVVDTVSLEFLQAGGRPRRRLTKSWWARPRPRPRVRHFVGQRRRGEQGLPHFFCRGPERAAYLLMEIDVGRPI